MCTLLNEDVVVCTLPYSCKVHTTILIQSTHKNESGGCVYFAACKVVTQFQCMHVCIDVCMRDRMCACVQAYRSPIYTQAHKHTHTVYAYI